MKVTLLHIGLAAFLATPAGAYSAQDADESALDALDDAPKPPPAKVEPAGAAELRDAMRRIAQRPSDSFALTDAGYAAIKLGDYDAAFNFFSKAGTLQPADARIKAGLGIAQVRRENPFEALSLFDEAQRLGASERSFALDRALAFDLLGNFERAERDYALAASFGSSDEVNLRHAISLSLAGRRDEADRLLIPLLQRENPEAWRARALMLASRGDYREAGKIALGFLSETEARRMDGYFRNMPRLTVAQQAAAMHFGHFPVGSNIGEDSGQVRSLAVATGAKPVPAAGDSRLIPAGEPLGAKPAVAQGEKPKKPPKKEKDPTKRTSGVTTASAQEAIDAAARAKVTTVSAARLPQPEAARPPVRIALPALARPQPRLAEPAVQSVPVGAAASTAIPSSSNSELPAVGPAVLPTAGPKVEASAPITQPPPTQPPPSELQQVRMAQIDPATVIGEQAPPLGAASSVPVAVAEKPVQGPPVGPGFDSLPSTAVVASSTVPAPAAPVEAVAQTQTLPPPAEKPFDLGALVASIDVPEEEKKPSVAPVDLKKIKPVAAKVEATAAAKADAGKSAKNTPNAPRIWVQIATGADANGLGFDYRRMAKKHSALFANRDGWTATWGKTRRLLVGPFPDMKAAKKWETDFRKAGGDGFVWQSDKNAEVEKLKGK